MIADQAGLVHPLERVSRAMGWAVVSAGVLALSGWLLDSGVLKSVVPGLTAMNPLTAMAFVCSGAALALLARDPPRPRRALVLAGAAAMAGLLVLAGYASGWGRNIDQVLFSADLASWPGLPNRMAPNTAVCFLLCGASLLLLAGRGLGGRTAGRQ